MTNDDWFATDLADLQMPEFDPRDDDDDRCPTCHADLAGGEPCADGCPREASCCCAYHHYVRVGGR